MSGPVRGRGVSQSRCPPAPRLRPGRGKLSQDRVAFHRTWLGRQQCDLANRSLPGPQARSAQRGDRASSPARPAAVGTEGACVSNALGARRSGGLRAPWLLPVHTSSPACSAVRSRPRRPLYHETARAPRTRLAEGHGLVRGGVYVTPSAPGSSRCELCELFFRAPFGPGQKGTGPPFPGSTRFCRPLPQSWNPGLGAPPLIFFFSISIVGHIRQSTIEKLQNCLMTKLYYMTKISWRRTLMCRVSQGGGVSQEPTPALFCFLSARERDRLSSFK